MELTSWKFVSSLNKRIVVVVVVFDQCPLVVPTIAKDLVNFIPSTIKDQYLMTGVRALTLTLRQYQSTQGEIQGPFVAPSPNADAPSFAPLFLLHPCRHGLPLHRHSQ
jgi:hypothetical protein